MTEAKPPVYLVRFVDGPTPGDYLHPGPWPLPQKLRTPSPGGRYVKVGESALTEDHPGVVRGAQYRWTPDEEERHG
jgi:hypothetical protein